MIDSNIPLGVRPVEPIDPLTAYSKAMGLRNSIQEGQLRQAQVQEYQQKIADQQRAVEAGKALSAALSESMTQGPDGKFSTDWDNVVKRTAELGYGPEALKADTQRKTDMLAAAQAEETKLKNESTRAGLVGSLAQSVLAAPPEQRAEALKSAISHGVQVGIVDPQTAQQLLSQPYTPGQTDAQLQQFVDRGMQLKDTLEHHIKDLQENREKLVADSTVAKNAEETSAKQRENWASQLASAKTPEKYAAILANAPKNVQAMFPQPQEWDASDVPKMQQEIRMIGMKPEEAQKALNPTVPEGERPLGPERVPQLNQALTARYQVLHPGKALPAQYTIPANATQKDFDRIDKVMEAEEKATGTKAQQDAINAARGESRATADQAALDREAASYRKPHEKSLADATSQLEKIADARAMVNGSAEAQAVGLPKVLTALVSGQGSGVRITQAEMNSIAKARGITGTIEGWVSQLSGQGKLNDTQKTQLTQVLDDVAERLKQKQSVANDAIDRINSAKSKSEIVSVDSELRHKLADMEKLPASGVATPKSKEEYDALPKGAHYMKNGQEFVKQ